jgi:pyruvate/2-oxoglutarate dehydrogenase complex dihydrolipoamide dehydrogenase (E3) component
MQSKEVDRIRNVYHEMIRNNGIERVEGRATFQDAHTLVVHNAEGDLLRTMTGANILLATGGRPSKLSIPGSELAVTSDQALSMPQAPKRVAIIGAGRVGTEFAGILAGVGAEVHLVFKQELPLPGAQYARSCSIAASLHQRMCLPYCESATEHACASSPVHRWQRSAACRSPALHTMHCAQDETECIEMEAERTSLQVWTWIVGMPCAAI